MSVLNFTPQTGIQKVGDDFDVFVMVDGTDAINAVGVEIVFNGAILSVVNVDYLGSPFTIQAEETITSGQVRLFRALPGGNSLVGQGRVAIIRFKALAEGTAILTFTPNCEVLRFADAANVLGATMNGVYSVMKAGPCSRADLNASISALQTSVNDLEAVL